MNKDKIISVSKDTVYYLTNFFPLAFCMAVCFGFGATTGILSACLTIILAPDLKPEKIMPVYTAFIILGSNTDVAFLACIIFFLLMLISAKFFDKIKKLIDSPAVSGVMLGTALTATVLFTTDYFGIGATGETIADMIKSYISLGFHPNWRGVLYGTIVMVIMITFPRKFKTLSKTVSAAFIGIIITLILNFFLNPSYMPTAITEIGNNGSELLLNYLSGRFIPELNYPRIILCSISLYINYVFASSEYNYYDVLANEATSIFISLPLPYGINRNKKSLSARCLAAGIILFIFVLLNGYICRIPLHACAVVVIVGAWQNVKWGELKKAFSGIIPVLMFVITIVSCLVFDLTIGVVISAVLSVVYHKFLKKAV